MNQQQKTQHISVFSTELFAHYLHIRCLSVMKCHQLTQTSSTDEVQRYQKCFYELQEMFTTDLMLLSFINRTQHPTNDQRTVIHSGQCASETPYELDTSELVELLQQSAIEHLTAFREIETQEFSSVVGIVKTDFEALYAYKRGEYQRCLQLSTRNVGLRTLIGVGGLSWVPTYPEFIQLMDDDIVSLIGLGLIVNPSYRKDGYAFESQLYLSLYLMVQCQMKLHHPVMSLAQTLDHIEVIRRHLDEAGTLDQLLLKLIERKLLLYISREFCSDVI